MLEFSFHSVSDRERAMEMVAIALANKEVEKVLKETQTVPRHLYKCGSLEYNKVFEILPSLALYTYTQTTYTCYNFVDGVSPTKILQLFYSIVSSCRLQGGKTTTATSRRSKVDME